MNRCWKCGNETQKFKICDDCYTKWNQEREVCQICELKKTGSRFKVCGNCKPLLVEEALNFLKSKPE